MTPRRLDWTLRCRGTLMSAWPAAEREAALALLRRSAEARALLADALSRDDSELTAASDGCALLRMQAALRGALLQLPPLTFALRWGVLAACAAVGLYLGLAGAAGDAAAEAGADQADAFSTVQTMTVASSL